MSPVTKTATSRQDAETFLRSKLGDTDTNILLQMIEDMTEQGMSSSEIQKALQDEAMMMFGEQVLPIIIILKSGA